MRPLSRWRLIKSVLCRTKGRKGVIVGNVDSGERPSLGRLAQWAKLLHLGPRKAWMRGIMVSWAPDQWDAGIADMAGRGVEVDFVVFVRESAGVEFKAALRALLPILSADTAYACHHVGGMEAVARAAIEEVVGVNLRFDSIGGVTVAQQRGKDQPCQRRSA